MRKAGRGTAKTNIGSIEGKKEGNDGRKGRRLKESKRVFKVFLSAKEDTKVGENIILV